MPQGTRSAPVGQLHARAFHEALREAIAHSGMTLESIQRRMAARGAHVSAATLSYWQSGQRRPRRGVSAHVLAALEQVLGLPREGLAGLVDKDRAAHRPALPPRGQRRWEELTLGAEALHGLLAEFGASTQEKLAVVSLNESVEIGPRRNLLGSENTVAVTAREEVDRYLFTYEVDPGCDVRAVTVTAQDNCRLGRVRTAPDARLLVAELLFDRPLRPGETHLFRYTYIDSNPVDFCNVYRGLRTGADVYVLWVKFDPSALPVHCYRFDMTNREHPEEGGTELFLGAHHTVHTIERAPAPGLYGIAWTWAS